jgi:hypothetical protein
MVIHDLDVCCITVRPAKANAPLRIYSYATLPFAISSKGFQMVARRVPQVGHCGCSVKLAEFAKRPVLNISGKFPDRFTVPQLFCLFRSK